MDSTGTHRLLALHVLSHTLCHRDEGFHLLHIGAWDNDLWYADLLTFSTSIHSPCSLEILKDWIGLIDEDGWVAREQILGEEARSRVSLVGAIGSPPRLTSPSGTRGIRDPTSGIRQSTDSCDGSHGIHRAPQSLRRLP